MAEVEKSVLGSVRLDSDVWAAVRGMDCSLNQFLRRALLSGDFVPKTLAGAVEAEQKRLVRAFNRIAVPSPTEGQTHWSINGKDYDLEGYPMNVRTSRWNLTIRPRRILTRFGD